MRAAGVVVTFLLLVGCSPAAPVSGPTPPGVVGSGADATPSAAPTVPPIPSDGTFDYQLGGAYPPADGVRIVTRDRSEPPVTGRYSICYVNAFQTQPQETARWTIPSRRGLLVTRAGRRVVDPDWPGEYLLDTSTKAKRVRLARIVGRWIDGCARDGYQAVEPDNLDSYTRSKGKLTRADNVAFAKLLVRRAHAAGLAIGQKNLAELGRTGRTRIGFDFAVAEECEVYRECGVYTDAYGDQVIEIEYSDQPRRAYDRACAARGAEIPVIRRDREVVPAGSRGYRYESC